MKKLINKFRLFFAITVLLFGFIALYPLLVVLCFIVEEKVKKQIVELIIKSHSLFVIISWLKSISEK